jgi:putative chitinase
MPADIGHLDDALREFDVTTPKRIAAFLAQVAHESGELRWFEEIWDPVRVPAQLNYDPPHPNAIKHGNVNKGDGFKYRGRCPLQLTWHDNYLEFGSALGVDLVSQPDRAKDPDVAYRIACRYWRSTG